jgi:hypothetical protein
LTFPIFRVMLTVELLTTKPICDYA